MLKTGEIFVIEAPNGHICEWTVISIVGEFATLENKEKTIQATTLISAIMLARAIDVSFRKARSAYLN